MPDWPASATAEFALAAFADLAAPDVLELLTKAPDPGPGGRALKRARRRDISGKTDAILAALRSEQLGQPPALTAAYAATVRSLISVITALSEQVKALQGQVEAHFGQHPDAELYLSQPGMGAILGARVLGEFGDDPHRYADGKARRNYAATSPITRARAKEGRRRPVHPQRPAHPRAHGPGLHRPDRLARSPRLLRRPRARGIEHNNALRRIANRLVGILHGCLKSRTPYDEPTAWSHRASELAP